MKLSQIIYNLKYTNRLGSDDMEVNSITFDSRKAENNCLFVAVKGANSDGHIYISEVIKKGAGVIVCEEIPSETISGITYIQVKDSSTALGQIASNFYNNPSYCLKLIGITGTNGKTTTATLLYDLYMGLGYKAGLISTVRNIINGREIVSTHTTPDAVQLNHLLSLMIEEGCSHCFMEVSSHAVVQNRIAGLHFTGGIFTNLTHDHLDFHKTFDEYLKAKKTFFDNLGEDAFALTNIDDRNGNVMLQNTKANKKNYSIRRMADYRCNILENHFSGLLLNVDGTEMWSRLTGTFNAYNILAAYSTAMLLGDNKNEILTGLSSLRGAEGRFECVSNERNIIGIVDYAHTPDALKNVLDTIREINDGAGKIITVVGAGGDRDKSKRPLMAGIASEKSNHIILTSDNPRSEEPEEIINEMRNGVDIINRQKVIAITDRREAINTACTIARDGDIILVAGKGHEKYQETKGIKTPFDDMKILMEFLNIK